MESKQYTNGCILHTYKHRAEEHAPTRPKSSTPRAAKMKKRRKKSRPRLLTSGRACTTVSSRVRTDCAIFSSFRTTSKHRKYDGRSNSYPCLLYTSDAADE